MTEQSDAIADLIYIHAITAAGDEGYVTGFDRRGHDYRNCQDAARAVLASPVFRRIQAEAWNEGYIAAEWNDEEVCKCSAWNDGECACGNYGNGHQIKRNPYRDATDV